MSNKPNKKHLLLRSSPQQSSLQRLNKIILAGFLLLALMLVYWSIVRAPAILSRDDNPRLVEAELRIQRGSIFDRAGVVLARTEGDGAKLTRVYPISNIGPAVGYYSFRHGTAGVEEGFDPILRGDSSNSSLNFQADLLHQPQQGQAIRLTLDADLQETAVSLLGDHTGAILLFQLNENQGTAHILTMVSHPSYDPNQLETQFETLLEDDNAPLLNRAVQGQYQPGLLLQPMIMATALEQGLISLENNVGNANRPIPIEQQIINCETTPPEATTWADVLQHRCPGPLVDLAALLDEERLEAIFADFGFMSEPQLPLNTEFTPSDPVANLQMAIIGQGNLTVTPMQVGLAWMAIVANGRLPQPVLVTAITNPTVENQSNQWESIKEEANEEGETAVSSNTAHAIQQALPQQDTMREFSTLVLSGPEGSVNGWYLGASTRYAVVVVIENGSDLAKVEEIGRAILQEAN